MKYLYIDLQLFAEKEEEEAKEPELDTESLNADEETDQNEPLKEESPEETPKEVIHSNSAETPKDSTPAESKTNDSKESDEDAKPAKKGYAPTPEQLAKVNSLTKRELTAEEVSVIPLKFFGNGLVKDRLFAVEDKALDDMARYANDGVSFLLDHQWANFFGSQVVFPFGRTLDAKVDKSKKEPNSPDDENKALYGHIYIVKGKTINGISTDTVIASFEDGTLKDVSVTFTVSRYVCSICGKDIWDDGCEHEPGKVYNGKLCYLIGKAPARLFEISGVWDGAYASATALGAEDIESQFEEVRDIKAAGSGTELFHVYSADGIHTFKKRENKKLLKPEIDSERAKAIAGENWQEDIFKLANYGKELLGDLVKDTIEWGVRANGEHFREDEYELLFKDMDVKRIKSFREMWRKQTSATIPNKRIVQPAKSTLPDETPDDAYKMNRSK